MSPKANYRPLKTNRRKFLASSLATALATPACLGMAFSPKAQRELSLDQLGYSTFASLTGTRFDVYQGSLWTKLHLMEASFDPASVAAHSLAAGIEPDAFSLIFRGVEYQPLEQNSYLFSHPRLGRFTMFIVPVGPLNRGTGHLYQAVFNRPANVGASATIYG
jgi:hypothetical protein